MKPRPNPNLKILMGEECNCPPLRPPNSLVTETDIGQTRSYLGLSSKKEGALKIYASCVAGGEVDLLR